MLPEADALEVLLDAYVDGAPQVRAAAARVAGGVSARVAETLLLFLLNDHHPAVYWHASRALSRRGFNVEEYLQRQLESGPEPTRSWAAQNLAKLQMPSAATFLLGALYDADPAVITSAAAGLLLLKEPGLVDRILTALEAAPPERRAAILQGLACCEYEHEPAWFTLAREADDAVHAHVRSLPLRSLTIVRQRDKIFELGL